MGAESRTKFVETTDINSVWKQLHNIYGGYESEDTMYSGNWNTVSFGTIKTVLNKYSESKMKSYLNKNLDKIMNDIPKRSSVTLDFGVSGYEVWSVKKSCPKNKKSPKYETKYVVYHMENYGKEKIDDYAKTATEANVKASRLTLSNGTVYHVKKSRVLISGTEETASFTIVKKTYKSKPKSVKKGSSLKEIHRYYIIGICAN